MQPEVLVKLLNDIEDRYPNTKKNILASTDNYVELIIKPTDSMKYHSIDFPGKEKVYTCKNQETYKKISKT